MSSSGIRLLAFVAFTSFGCSAKEPVTFESDGTIRRGTKLFNDLDHLLTEDRTREHKCGTRVKHKGKEPGERRHLLQSHCENDFTNPSEQYAPNSGTLYRISTVVHVITNGATGLLSLDCVKNGISMLNDQFRARADTKAAASVDVRIEFALATVDGDGAATGGVHYYDNAAWFNVASTGADSTNNAMWAAVTNKYPTDQYLNIITKAAGDADGDVLLGYATLPATNAGLSDDGVVIGYYAWGNSTCSEDTSANGGTTLTHEAGHYLGLMHTFDDYGGGGEMGNAVCGASSEPWCYQTGDLLCDTPPQAVAIYDCTDHSSCGHPDHVNNFMDCARSSPRLVSQRIPSLSLCARLRLPLTLPSPRHPSVRIACITQILMTIA
jgi:hypothetical protein